uniref:Uncharacterized protein n=1 Tax=Rangifer tarandus platyrhynchus TaxID=3082113 RepID=A0ACB0DZ87_RANTA|nr:unnamed protein product [Rangifer tarandus platyrhynchus]
MRAELPVFGPRALGGRDGSRALTGTQGPGRLVLALGRDFRLHDPSPLEPDLGDPRLQESAPPPDRLWVTLSCGRVRMGVEVAASHPLGAQSFALVTASPSPQGGPGPTLRSSGALAPGRQAPPQSGHQKQRGVLGGPDPSPVRGPGGQGGQGQLRSWTGAGVQAPQSPPTADPLRMHALQPSVLFAEGPREGELM